MPLGGRRGPSKGLGAFCESVDVSQACHLFGPKKSERCPPTCSVSRFSIAVQHADLEKHLTALNQKNSTDIKVKERFQTDTCLFQITRGCGLRPVLFSSSAVPSDRPPVPFCPRNGQCKAGLQKHKQPAAHGRSITGPKWAPAEHGQVNMSACYYDSSSCFVWTAASATGLNCGKPTLKERVCRFESGRLFTRDGAELCQCWQIFSLAKKRCHHRRLLEPHRLASQCQD